MLIDTLKSKKCFKLVCGAGNEDAVEVEKLTALYSSAGCNFFDISADIKILEAARKGLKTSGFENKCYICVSVGISGDPHIAKAVINHKICTGCAECISICPQQAITVDKTCKVNQNRCIGCLKCEKICKYSAINFSQKTQKLDVILPPLIKNNIDCIELHASSTDDIETFEKWIFMNNSFDGVLSICIDRSKLGNEQILKRVKKMLEIRKPYTTIIQADGAPMSGCDDTYKTTLQAVASAEIFQNANLPAYILLSGGTNSKTVSLAKLCSIQHHGVAIGSYARMIVKDYIQRKDFLTNKDVFEEALIIAKKLVDSALNDEVFQ